MSRPLVIAHRGASGERPENTLAAFALALEQGADMLELDLQLTRDGAIVILHDDGLAGLGGRGAVADATLAEVQALDAGEGERVPTLDAVLKGFAGRIAFNLELKRGRHGAYAGLEQATLAVVDRYRCLGDCLFSCFQAQVLETLGGLRPEARIGLLRARSFGSRALARARALGAEAIHPGVALVRPERVAAAHQAGLAVYTYTVDAPRDMERLLGMGVDGLFTNFPGRMRRLLEAETAGPEWG